MPETDRAAPKRALRRVGSSRNNSLTRGVLPQTLTPRALSPKLQSRASTRNKYVLREEKEREEEEGRRDETSESIVQSAADRGVLVQSDSAMFRSRGYLADKDKADDSQGRSRLRMTMVDGVNSMGRSRVSAMYQFFYFFFRTLLLSSFWTSRGRRCRPFFPSVLAFNFYRA